MKFSFNNESQLYWFNEFLNICFDKYKSHDIDRDAIILGAFKAFDYSEKLLELASDKSIKFTFSENEEMLLTVLYENDLISYYYAVIEHLTPNEIIQHGYTNKAFKPKIKVSI